MSVTLGSILFPGRQKAVVENRKGVHGKRKKQVSSSKSQEQTAKQFTTRLLLDDETINPSDFLTPFPTDEIRNTEQFWEYMERVFYPIDERWVNILDLTARPQSVVPDETSIGLHFSYRWALVDLFDVEELFKLVDNKERTSAVQSSNSQNQITTRRRGLSTPDRVISDQDKQKSKKEPDPLTAVNLTECEDNQTELFESRQIEYLKSLDLPLLELIGVSQIGETPHSSKKSPCNPYFEEWKYLYQRLCYIEKEIDTMIKALKRTISDNIKKDNSRKLLQRHQKRRCREFLVRSLHFHCMRQFMDSLEEVLYFDSASNSYLTTWDDGEAVRAAWVTQDQLLQLLLFRQNTTESKYSVSIPAEYVPYARSLRTPLFSYLVSSGFQPIPSPSFDSPGNGNAFTSGTHLDEGKDGQVLAPEKGCIKLTRYPLCHYCRRSCSGLNYSRCPSKLKPLNISFLTASPGVGAGGSNSGGNNPQNKFQISTGGLTQGGASSMLPGNSQPVVSSSSALNVCFSRSLVPWRASRVIQKSGEDMNHSSPGNKDILLPHTYSPQSHHHTLTLNCCQMCDVCSGFESLNANNASKSDEIVVSRAYSPNNCWRMYCSDCILHNFSSVFKQKHSNGVVLRYYCPFCSGSCNCERCLRNQQIRKIKNYLKSRFSGQVLHCAVSSLFVEKEVAWCDFLLQFGCNLVGTSTSTYEGRQDNKKDVTDSVDIEHGNTALPVNENGEINESAITLKNIANISYINNYSIRMSVSENTHLGFIWLQANNIPFQKPQSSNNNSVSGAAGDHVSRVDSGVVSGTSGSNGWIHEPVKNVSKSKLKRASLAGTNKNKKVSIGQAGAGSISSGYEVSEPGKFKTQGHTHSLSSSGAPYSGSIVGATDHQSRNSALGTTGDFASCSAGIRYSGHNIPPSVHIPREVLGEPTNASGTSVLWSLRSILSNNVNRYHRECVSNLEKWEEIKELYKKKKNDLEDYFDELLSKLGAMDDWIRSISFTETNKRHIMRKLPLLCWATGIPSVRSFNFDDYSQLAPADHIVNLVRVLKAFVEDGVVSEDLPVHPVSGGDSVAMEMDESGESEPQDNYTARCKGEAVIEERMTSDEIRKSLPSSVSARRNHPKPLFPSSLGTPTYVMDYLFKAVPDLQKVVVSLVSNTSKDETCKSQKSQRNCKKDKNPVNNAAVGCLPAKEASLTPCTDLSQQQHHPLAETNKPQPQVCINHSSGIGAGTGVDGTLGGGEGESSSDKGEGSFVSEGVFGNDQELNLFPDGFGGARSGFPSRFVGSKSAPFGGGTPASKLVMADGVGSSDIQGSRGMSVAGTLGDRGPGRLCESGGAVGCEVGGALGFRSVTDNRLVSSSQEDPPINSSSHLKNGFGVLNPFTNPGLVSANPTHNSNANLVTSGGYERLASSEPHSSRGSDHQTSTHIDIEDEVNIEFQSNANGERLSCLVGTGIKSIPRGINTQRDVSDFDTGIGSKANTEFKAEVQFKDMYEFEAGLNVTADPCAPDTRSEFLLKRRREKEDHYRVVIRRSNNVTPDNPQACDADFETCENETEDSSSL